jgi:hypothetical protein
MDCSEWREERNFVSKQMEKIGTEGVRRFPRNGAFNYSKTCFLGYCEMQRATTLRQGFDDSAQYIQHCIDDLNGA